MPSGIGPLGPFDCWRRRIRTCQMQLATGTMKPQLDLWDDWAYSVIIQLFFRFGQWTPVQPVHSFSWMVYLALSEGMMCNLLMFWEIRKAHQIWGVPEISWNSGHPWIVYFRSLYVGIFHDFPDQKNLQKKPSSYWGAPSPLAPWGKPEVLEVPSMHVPRGVAGTKPSSSWSGRSCSWKDRSCHVSCHYFRLLL